MLRTVERGAIGLLAAYILYTQALGTALISIGLAIIIFAFTKNETFLLCVLAVTLLIKPLNNVINSKPEPMGVEGFQARDPVSVQTRL